MDPEEDVEPTVVDGALWRQAELQEESNHKGRATYRSGFHHGPSFHALPLSAGTEDEDINAAYRDGVLEAWVPLTDHDETAETKEIEVTGG